jgi:alanine racemase
VRSGQGGRPVRLHVKLDTGIGRLGTRDSAEALAVAREVLDAEPATVLIGAMTHFATADEDPSFVAEQLAAFTPFVEQIRRAAPEIVVHAANNAATLNEAASHFDMVRCGIAIYGCDPMNQDAGLRLLEPALELSSYVAAVKLARAGESAGYGRRFIARQDTWIATLPIGYADGISRSLSDNCDVLVSARRYRLVGAVSMDNITVDLGPEPVVRTGEVATIIGGRGSDRKSAEDVAKRLGTINYEVVWAISSRVPRVYHRDGEEP